MNEEQKRKKLEYNKKWKLENKDKVREAQKRYRERIGREEISIRNKEYREKNPEYRHEYYIKNKDKEKEYNNKRTVEQIERKKKTDLIWKNKKYKEDISYKLRQIISVAINRSLKTKKDGDIHSYLDYSIEDLRKHLEGLFEDWMTWENMGLTALEPKQTWQIDHIIPVNTFGEMKINSSEFKRCWALDNLRPLDSYYNVRRNRDGKE